MDELIAELIEEIWFDPYFEAPTEEDEVIEAIMGECSE